VETHPWACSGVSSSARKVITFCSKDFAGKQSFNSPAYSFKVPILSIPNSDKFKASHYLRHLNDLYD